MRMFSSICTHKHRHVLN